MVLWLIPALLAQGAWAQTGWIKQASSLLLYDSSGSLTTEIGLTHSEQAADDSYVLRDRTGGAAPGGRFAWTFGKKTTWNPARTKLLGAKTLFRYFGSGGRELWETSGADAPEDAAPVSLSDDGEVLLLSRHGVKGWTAALMSYVGTTLWEAGPFPVLESVRLTGNGKYAQVRWLEVDQSSTNTFIEAATQKRKDIPSEEFALGNGRVDGDGKVYAGKKVLFDFAAIVP